MAIHDLKAQIARLPEQPGVYLYFDRTGETIYVGKARSLRDRVRSYLGARGLHVKTDALLEEIDRLEYIVTDSVVEALALENNIIKTRNPKYNIRLRDDKNYPYLQLTTGERFPRVLVARRRRARRARLRRAVPAGPAGAADDGAHAPAVRHPIVQRGDHRQARAAVPRVRHQALHRAVRRHASARRRSISKPSRTRGCSSRAAPRSSRATCAAACRTPRRASGIEEAAQLRDAVLTVETLAERHQKMATPDLGARDVFGLRMGSEGAVVQVFQVRSGRVVDRVELVTEAGEAAMISRATCWPRR